MKKLYILALSLLLAVSMIGCKTQPAPQQSTTLPQTTAPQLVTTQDPFEFESEIDFSDFATEPVSTDPVDTAPEEPEVTEPEVTDPKPTKPAPTQPEETQPEQTDPPETAAPVYEPDGYNSQIVRP